MARFCAVAAQTKPNKTGSRRKMVTYPGLRPLEPVTYREHNAYVWAKCDVKLAEEIDPRGVGEGKHPVIRYCLQTRSAQRLSLGSLAQDLNHKAAG
eukprot:6200492-Pleurochrysis_carterae.AAC.2